MVATATTLRNNLALKSPSLFPRYENILFRIGAGKRPVSPIGIGLFVRFDKGFLSRLVRKYPRGSKEKKYIILKGTRDAL